MQTSTLHISKYFPPHRGGMETFLGDLMAAQQRSGTRVAALVHSSDRRLHDTREACDFGGQTLSVTRAAVWLTLVFAPIAPGFIFTLRRMLRVEQPTVLHLHLPNPSVFWLLLLPSARALPWVVHWHSDVVATQPGRGLRLLLPLYRPLEQAILARATRILTTSPPYLESSAALQKHRSRCVMIPLGLDPQRLLAPLQDSPPQAGATEQPLPRPSPSQPPLHESRPQLKPLELLAVGRLTYYKGFATLLDALAQLPDARLTIIGSGVLKHALQTQARKLKLGKRLTLRGGTSDAALALAFEQCDLLVLPSLERTEAFGLVLLEGMVFSKALVASDVQGSGMPWVIEQSGAGRICPPGNADALARTILEISADRDKLRSLGESGKRHFYEYFHIDIAARRIQSVYEGLYDDPTGNKISGKT